MLDMKGVDLNLLVSLDVLIEEANVTRAAARLGVSQPGLSAQLARLRDLFGDPLLVPSESGRGMLPTSRALELKGPLHAALKDLETVVRHPPRFDPKVDSRTFAIAASDNATIVLGLPLMERLRDEAGSGVRIAFQAARSDVVATQLERGEVDILIGSERMVPPAMKARKLIDEMYVMVQRRGHPRGTAHSISTPTARSSTCWSRLAVAVSLDLSTSRWKSLGGDVKSCCQSTSSSLRRDRGDHRLCLHTAKTPRTALRRPTGYVRAPLQSRGFQALRGLASARPGGSGECLAAKGAY